MSLPQNTVLASPRAGTEESTSDPNRNETLENTIIIQDVGSSETDQYSSKKLSSFRSLGLLDRLLAVWIILAMAIGIILGNFVPNTGTALQRGEFVGVSVPIGEGLGFEMVQNSNRGIFLLSNWTTHHDVSYPM